MAHRESSRSVRLNVNTSSPPDDERSAGAGRVRLGLVLFPVIAAVIALLAWALRAPGGDLILYASADDAVVRELVGRFERETGLSVLFVGDAESQKTTALAQRLRDEADHPIADVFWSSEILHTIRLAQEGVLAAPGGGRPSGATGAGRIEWPAHLRAEDDRWFAFAARARVIAYMPSRVAEEIRPQSWTDLTHSRWQGRIVMADPRFGTTGTHLAMLSSFFDARAMPGYYEAFAAALVERGIRILPGGNAAVVQAVINGEADLGLTDTDDVLAAQSSGAAVEMLLVRAMHEPDDFNGVALIPNTVGVVAGAAHGEAAERFVRFLLSPEVEQWLSASPSGNYPLGPDAHAAPGRAAPAGMRVSWEDVARRLERSIAPFVSDAPPESGATGSAPEPGA